MLMTPSSFTSPWARLRSTRCNCSAQGGPLYKEDIGQGDLAKIDLVGSDLESCTRKFRMADSIAGQLKWKSDDFQSISLKGDVRS